MYIDLIKDLQAYSNWLQQKPFSSWLDFTNFLFPPLLNLALGLIRRDLNPALFYSLSFLYHRIKIL